MIDPLVQAKKQQAWRRGVLRWKLRPHQQKAYDQIKATQSGSFYLNKARRIGGSYLLAVLAVQKCLEKPGAQVKYAAPTAKAVRKIISPNIRKIIKDCPKEIRPKFVTLEGEWQFPNGSSIAVAGCDKGQAENLRGTESDFVCLDEVGFIQDLEYILNDILAPQVKDTGGVIVLTSTPARSPAHESFKMAMAHKATGRYSHITVWDDVHYSHKQHEDYFRKMAQGKGLTLQEYYRSTTFRRQYLGEFVTDEQRSVIPEWSQALQKHITDTQDHRLRDIPEFRDRYVSIDLGWRDGMGVLFAYWDYRKAVLVIQSQLLMFKKTSQQVVESIRAMQIQLWGKHQPYLRISDNDLQNIADLNSHGVTFIPTKKDDKQLQVNNLRQWLRAHKIWINPRCRRLLSQLGSTIWNQQRTSYQRNSEGHGDLLDALVYLVRNIRRERNPFPDNYGVETGFDWLVTDPDSTSSSNTSKFQKVMTKYFQTEINDE